MLARGSGKIVNIASLLTFQGGILVPSYAAAKGGVGQLTKAFANEWASKGINVNAIAPGYMDTDNTEALRNNPERARQILERIPAGRWGKPEDLAGAAVFLASRGQRLRSWPYSRSGRRLAQPVNAITLRPSDDVRRTARETEINERIPESFTRQPTQPRSPRPSRACCARCWPTTRTSCSCVTPLKKGWKGARHSHPHHQMVYVVRGHIRFQAEGKSWELRAGDSIVVDGGVEHEASAFEPSEVLDIFTPYRQDYA